MLEYLCFSPITSSKMKESPLREIGPMFISMPISDAEQEVLESVREIEAEKLARVGYFLRHVSTVQNDKRLRVVGGRIFFRRLNETFHEFLVEIFKITMGKIWCDDQKLKPTEERHFIFRCYENYLEWIKKNKNEVEFEKTGRYSGLVDGYTAYFICLAYDFYCLKHSNNFSLKTLEKLKKNGHSFQGARYEIAIASVFARANFNLEYYGEDIKSPPGVKRCEFRARCRITGVLVEVEAKSKHREGVLHDERSLKKPKRLLKGNIRKLVQRGLEKDVNDNAFLIFIDLNSPMTPEKIFNKPWIQSVFKVMRSTAEDKDRTKENGIFVTNFSYHYQKNKLANKGEYVFSKSLIPENSLSEEVWNRLFQVLNNYGIIPDLDMALED